MPSSTFFGLLVSSADSLDPDPNCLTLMVFLKEFFEKDGYDNYSADCKKRKRCILQLNVK